MNKTHTQPHTESLPRLHSHKKFTRNVTTQQEERKQTEEDVSTQARIGASSEKQGIHVRMNSQKKTLRSANSSKAVKYQNANALYQKKIEALEKQNFILDRELLSVKEEVNQLRVKSRLGDNDNITVTSKISKATTKRTEQTLLKTDLKGASNRLEALRKKIDKQNERNRKLEKQVDKVRKEITTTKKLNEQMVNQLKEVTDKFNYQNSLFASLDQQLAVKNQMLHQKKIQSIHQKAHLIKSYDTILKKLHHELEGDKGKQTAESRQTRIDFYLTDIYGQNTNPKRKGGDGKLTENSPKNKKSAAQITFLKEKIGEYQQQFNQLREKTASGSNEEVTQKFLEEYQLNFGKYNFINERYAHLQELKLRNAELKKRKEQFIAEQQKNNKSRASNEVSEIKEQINKIQNSKKQLKQKQNNINNLYISLKEFVIDFMGRIPLPSLCQKYQIDQSKNISDVINQDNLLQFLQQIQALKETLDSIPDQAEGVKNISHATSQSCNPDMMNSARSNVSANLLEQYFELAKKESHHDKEKLFDRQDFLKNKQQNLARKKNHSSKAKSHKN